MADWMSDGTLRDGPAGRIIAQVETDEAGSLWDLCDDGLAVVLMGEEPTPEAARREAEAWLWLARALGVRS